MAATSEPIHGGLRHVLKRENQRDDRVEDGRGRLGHVATRRFPSPLIEPDVPISGIRLSDWFHREAHGKRSPTASVIGAACSFTLRYRFLGVYELSVKALRLCRICQPRTSRD